MIISHKHKYLFIEIPHTGSTAISKELIEKYDGESILHKHANYCEFKRIARSEELQYFVFAGVRNPLDEAASLYMKFLNNHDGLYTDPKNLIKNGGWLSEKKVKTFEFVQATQDFNLFLRKHFSPPYTDNININKKYCDYVMKFEQLDKEFSKVLQLIGVKKVRSLPIVNKTNKKDDYLGLYTHESAEYAKKVFWPFMQEWGYDLPKEWTDKKSPSTHDKVSYEIAKRLRDIYARHIKSGVFKNFALLRNMVE